MKKKKISYYKLAFITLVLLEGIFFYLSYRSFNNKDVSMNEINLPENKANKNNMFAIMLGDKNGVYTASKSDKWPDGRYTYNASRSGCIDGNGNLLENVLLFDTSTRIVKVTKITAAYCYLYFDLEQVAPQSFIFYLGGSTNPEYTTTAYTSAYLSWTDTDVTKYCLTEELNSTNCTWNNTSGTSMTVDYTLSKEDGTKTVYAYLMDAAENISPAVIDTIILDGAPPVDNSVVINNNAAYTTSTSVTLTLTSSGAEEMCISNTNTCTNWEAYASSKTHTLTSALGTKTVYVKYRDASGNETETVSDTIALYSQITVPSQNGTLTYTGISQSPKWNNYNTTQLTIGGTTSGTNAGSYNATFTPKTNYIWSDGTTGVKTVAWSIGKAAGSLSVSPTTLSLTSGESGTITVTKAGNGVVSATSSNTSAATVSVSGTTVTVKGVSGGSATITIKVAAGTNHNAPANKTVSVTVVNPLAGPAILSKAPAGLDTTTSYGGMYRFTGTDPNNYVDIGGVIYRIIGITSEANSTLGLEAGQLKVIKATSIGNINWHTYYSFDVKWGSNSLYSYLQGSSVLGNTSIIPSGWSDKIDSVKWNIGDVHSTLLTAATVLGYENDEVTSGTSKIALMYLSDYFYAYRAGVSVNCYTSACKSWMTDYSNHTWTMTRYGEHNNGSSGMNIWYVYYDGSIYWHNMSWEEAIRPTFYLLPSVTVKTGSGTSDDPFILE